MICYIGIQPKTNEVYEYLDTQIRTFPPGESSFPIEKATEKERGEDDGEGE